MNGHAWNLLMKTNDRIFHLIRGLKVETIAKIFLTDNW